jgi:hypothetical protein
LPPGEHRQNTGVYPANDSSPRFFPSSISI